MRRDVLHSHTRFHGTNLLVLLVYKMLVGKPEGKRPLGRPKRRWEDYVKSGS
jgi:hypothetical protein